MATNVIANISDINVLVLIPSCMKCDVIKANTIIPKLNPTNLPGHKSPSNPATIYLVDKMSKYDTGMPTSANNKGLSLNHVHTN